jgi:hypothetical protein
MVVYSKTNVCEDVRQMLYEHFAETEQYSAFILCYQLFTYDEFLTIKNRHPDHRIIVYQLEQLPVFKISTDAVMILRDCDEVWDYDAENIRFLASHGIKAKLMPMIPTKAISACGPIIGKDECDIDLLFYGAITEERNMKLVKLMNSCNTSGLKMVMLSGIYGEALDEYIRRSKIILNIHAYRTAFQEQVRIFKALSSNRCVLSEPSLTNHFGEAVIEVPAENLFVTARDLIESGKYIKMSNSVVRKWKDATERPKNGGFFRSLFGRKR